MHSAEGGGMFLLLLLHKHMLDRNRRIPRSAESGSPLFRFGGIGSDSAEWHPPSPRPKNGCFSSVSWFFLRNRRMMLRENLLRRFSRLPRAAKPPSHKIAPVANEKRSLEATFITIVLSPWPHATTSSRCTCSALPSPHHNRCCWCPTR